MRNSERLSGTFAELRGTNIKTQKISYWHTQLVDRECLPQAQGRLEVDVCIVGGGLTGLWSAYYLAKARPQLRIVVVERQYVGYGASGRNGGWLSNFLPGIRRQLARKHKRDAVLDFQRQMTKAVDEVIRVCEAEGIDADIVKSGVLTVARTKAQWSRLQQMVDEDLAWGEQDQILLEPGEFDKRIRVRNAIGAAFSPNCARVQPAKLTQGLADCVQNIGVVIYENTPAIDIQARTVVTPDATICADHVVLATEGFTSTLPSYRRQLLPMNSSVIITDPLPDRLWDQIGWTNGELLGDMAHMYFYAQRTADGRIAFGGRGNPYRYASRFEADGFTPRATVEELHQLLLDCFPALHGHPLADAWSGVLGVSRDWCAAIVSDSQGRIRVGGYAGHGLTTTNLAGQTVRDLVLGLDSDLTTLPWVNHACRNWEPEPLRWVGVHGVYSAYRLADYRERVRQTGATSRFAKVANYVSGR